jgi:predicted PurR-regulated permease PerM
MLDRIGRWLAGIPGALWRATIGRFFAKPAPVPPPRVVVGEPEEPRSIAGITLRATLVVVAVALALYLAYQLRQLLILGFLAVLFAAGLNGPAAWLERRGLPRTPAVLLTYLALIVVLALVVIAIFPPLAGQAVQLIDQLPDLFGQLRAAAIEAIDQFAGEGATERVIDTITQGAQDALPGLTSLLQVPLTVLGILVNVLLIFFLSALLLLERDAIRGWAMQFIDADDRPAVQLVVERAVGKLGAYVRGQLVLMTSIGLGAGLGMLLVGIFTTGEPLPFLFPMSLLAFFGEAIPLVGAFVAPGRPLRGAPHAGMARRASAARRAGVGAGGAGSRGRALADRRAPRRPRRRFAGRHRRRDHRHTDRCRARRRAARRGAATAAAGGGASPHRSSTIGAGLAP